MGNNVYETPRNKSKWHTTTDKGKNHNANSSQKDDKLTRLEKLRKQALANKEKNRTE